MAATPRIIVVGGGLAGLAAVIKIAEAGGKVDLFSIVPVKRSHSVCAQGGINSGNNLKGACRGISAMDLRTMETRTFPADAIIVCTGGNGAIFGKSTNSVVCTGSAQSALYQQGAYYANGEFIQVHPTAIPGEDKLRLMSESARGEGGRVWVPRNPAEKRAPRSIPDGERFYFLEEWYPKYGNLVPRDIATRAIHRIVYQEKLGIDGQSAVYLDVTHIPRETLDRKLEGILEIYEKFLGVDPRVEPMKVFPAMHYTMGGIWVNGEDQASNVPGIYAAGECEYQYHGANRLGANSLVSCIFGGGIAGPAAVKYAKNLEKGAESTASAVFDAERKRQEEKNQKVMNQDGSENPITIWRELGDVMTEHVTVTRINKNLEMADGKIRALQERYKKINLSDRTKWSNQTLNFARELENMIVLARVITLGALARNESRGG